MNETIKTVTKEVMNLLSKDLSGHNMDHIKRVYNLSIKFCNKENGNLEIVSLISLLHDVDDYKIFGIDNENNLSNTKLILNKCNINNNIKDIILNEIKCLGYHNAINNIIPKTIEGKIVSDADMCDALGANGILRTYSYSLNKNRPFFDKQIIPNEFMSYEEYINKKDGTGINHLFEKILKLPSYMLTNSGKIESQKRYQFVISFLHQFFYENVPEWEDYLNKYIKNV